MSSLVTADELGVRLLFPDPVSEVIEFLREVINQREPLVLMTDDVARVVNFANVASFTVAERDRDDPALDADGVTTVVISLAECRQAAQR